MVYMVAATAGDLNSLVQPIGGLISGTACHRALADEPAIVTRLAQLGDVSQLFRHDRTSGKRSFVTGAGAGLNDRDCMIPALAEGLERYCASMFSEEQVVYASGKELGHDALDLEAIPRCSELELCNPKCPLVAPDPKAPLRWVRGLSLLTGRMTYIPAVMVYLNADFASRQERISLPISTGCACHLSLERAVLAGILEVIERDAISLTWLQKLPLPRIEIDRFPPLLARCWEFLERGSRDLNYFFFDATTDLKISTIYGVQVCAVSRRVATLVGCSTALDPADAIVKVMFEMASCKLSFRRVRPVPSVLDDFTDILHGATYMARREQLHAFDFLLHSGSSRMLSEIPTIGNISDENTLLGVIERLRRKNLEIYVVELSTDEALRAGARVVRVIIPGLQPLSFHHRARYLGHPRLYKAPEVMGYPVRSEHQLNHFPQPFA